MRSCSELVRAFHSCGSKDVLLLLEGVEYLALGVRASFHDCKYWNQVKASGISSMEKQPSLPVLCLINKFIINGADVNTC